MLTQKTSDRVLPEDWHRRLQGLRSDVNAARENSFKTRNETKYFRNEIENKGWWDHANNTTRLQDRVYEVKRVRDDLLNTLNKVKYEIELLVKTKETAEREVEARVVPIDVVFECLALRERRRDGDLVKDDPEIQLHSELKTFERSKSDLERQVLDCLSHLKELDTIKQRLEADIRDKNRAINIDSDQCSLTIYSPKISFKPTPYEPMKGSISPSMWISHSVTNMSDADDIIKKSQELREQVCLEIQGRRREDDTQIRETDFALRRREHQETRARDELHWERGNLLEEVRNQEIEISKLEDTLRKSTEPLKVAQTRLENRKQREGKDLVEDAAQDGLRAESIHLVKSRDLLRQNLDVACKTLRTLQEKLRELDADLARKNLSVMLECKTKDARKKFKDETKQMSLTEENLIQTGSLRAYPISLLD